MNEFDNATYIKAQESPSEFSFYDPAPLFRHEFSIDENILSAHIYVQSPGFATFYVNGIPITEDIFISPVSDYGKLLWYNSYDVTPLLHKGKNVIGAIAGNGFFNESFDSAWHYDRAYWRDSPQILVCLKINGKATIVSNSQWKVNIEKSHIVYNHLRSGEYVDMRKFDTSWLSPNYDASDWKCAIERAIPAGAELLPVRCEPVREVEKIQPRAIKKLSNGYLLDFGVTVSGYAQVVLQAKRGTEILLQYAEEIDEHGNPKHNNMDSENFYRVSPFQLDKMIASGAIDTFKPMFSYHGFRYLIISGLEQQPIDIIAYFIHNDIKRISEFSSGCSVLNYIYNAGIRSTYSNMFWCLTDCPTREKLGWMNDAQATVEQGLINFDITAFYTKWLDDIKAGMRDDGALSGIIPSPKWGFSCGPICDCLLYEIPYRVYLYTGNARYLKECIPYFERYVDYLDKKLNDGHEFALGDWLGHENSPLIPKRFVAEFYLIKALRITVLAKKLAAECYGKLEQRLRTATESFLNEYLDGNGYCTVTEQSAISMMLVFGLYRDKAILCSQLVSVVERDEYRLTCGMVGVQYLYDALTMCGRSDIAYTIISESEPGYKTWFKNGATTLWESWDGKDNGSHNHHMFSGVIAWFYKSLLGISPSEDYPAFECIELSPSFVASIGHVYGVMNTVKGRIEAQWEYRDGSFIYTVDIPDGISASFCGKHLRNGKNQFIIKDNTNENH